MAMDIAQEFGPEGIHVAHVVLDGRIDTPDLRAQKENRDDETLLDPDAIADTYWHLVEQDDHSPSRCRSRTAGGIPSSSDRLSGAIRWAEPAASTVPELSARVGLILCTVDGYRLDRRPAGRSSGTFRQ